MKKFIIIFLASILIISSLGLTAIGDEKTNKKFLKTNMKSLVLSEPNIKKYDNSYSEISIKGVSTFITSPGKPMLPKIVKTYELPFGAKNFNLEVELSGQKSQKISTEIKPCPMMLPKTTITKSLNQENVKDLSIYQSKKLYPENNYDYKVLYGLNKDNIRKSFLVIDIYPVKYSPKNNIVENYENANIKFSYEIDSSIEDFSKTSAPIDLVIITPNIFKNELVRLKEHKNDNNVKTIIKTTQEIYNEYQGFDEPEQIKYYIKDAIEKYDIKYVLLVGGLKSQIFAKPRDNENKGVKGWHLPVRYTNLFDKPKFPLESDDDIFDPGVICDLYYADIYKEGGEFSSWDVNGDGIYAAWAHPDPEIEDDLYLDLTPDVCVGRLACRNKKEVKTVVDKIINYESNPVDTEDWFNKMTVISGDGFLDQEDLNFKWNTNGLENGYYTIYAQSINDECQKGPIQAIQVLIDRTKKTKITFSHDDHLNPALEGFIYPAPPIAEIVTISDGDILGYNDYKMTPGENLAYCNNFNPWANVSYENGILTIRGKSYDPKPYGNITSIHVWIKESKYGKTIFSDWRNNTEMYYEGEWTTGEKELLGRGGALYYMDDFVKEKIWTSMGNLNDQPDVIEAINKGCGFLFFSGHGSPNSWGDHYPAAPGNRQYGSITGLEVTKLNLFKLGGVLVGTNKIKNLLPLYPMDTLSNGEKLPVAVIGGCHNSQFNVSMIPGFYEGFQYLFPNSKLFRDLYMWCHGSAVPECYSWRLVRNPNGGSIASIGNTGLGYGMPGKVLTVGGGDGWITIEFFYQYGNQGQTVLGNAHSQAISHYIQTFDMTDLEAGHAKSVQQWVLLGDPSLQIGGY